jgi:type II secretory pathway pseudopilin PulG
MSTVVFVIVGVLIACAAASLFLWSRWSEREAAYEPERLSEDEASVYRLGIALGANQGGGTPMGG